MSAQEDPLVSCLCVTEDRPAFMPWLLWCFDRQRWARRELVIVDSSREPLRIEGRDDVRVIVKLPSTGVARKRNIAMREARGEIFTWFDDDDWQHPDKLTGLVEALKGPAPLAGSPVGWFVNLSNRLCRLYRATQFPILFNSAGFRREEVLSVQFAENVRKASDSRWLSALAMHHDNRLTILSDTLNFFWLCHGDNLSNPAKRRRFSEPIRVLKDAVGSEDWGDTDDALDGLWARLAGRAEPGTAEPSAQEIPPSSLQAGTQGVSRGPSANTDAGVGHQALTPEPGPAPKPRASGEQPAEVSVVIKATVMDAPFLDVLVRHMIGQARFDFKERILVVDRRPAFGGKYRSRPVVTEDELDRILQRLLAEKVIDRVVEPDPDPAAIGAVMKRYFGADGSRVPTHATSGGPIYATLFGLEASSTDSVLQMDADVFFYTSGGSWVEEALGHLERDPDLWLMMTHPGPPAGPVGRSLGPRNARLAVWDPVHCIWRFRTATTRYFLCYRRRLYGRLRPLLSSAGCAPLEQCIGAALQGFHACRGALGGLGSWHLHAWYHSHPFPDWAPMLARAIEAGRFPTLQLGSYDLHLGRPRDRDAWCRLLGLSGVDGHPDPRVSGGPPAAEGPVQVPGTAENGVPRGIDAGGPSSAGVVTGRSDPLARPTQVQHPRPHGGVDPAASGAVADTNRGESVSDCPPSGGTDPDTGAAALSVIIPVRDRTGSGLRNALSSLQWQSAGRPAEILVVSHGSRPDTDEVLGEICGQGAARLLIVADPGQSWNKPEALNVGIRASSLEVPFLMTMDADMILARDFLDTVLGRLRTRPWSLILCRSADLPEAAEIPTDARELLAEFPRLRSEARLRGHFGTGGIQAAPRSFFFEARGYDEDLKWWGAMDTDMVNRARIGGLDIDWIEDRTAMLHQWHPRKHLGLQRPEQVEQARRAWQTNHAVVRRRKMLLRRNPNGWGGQTG